MTSVSYSKHTVWILWISYCLSPPPPSVGGWGNSLKSWTGTTRAGGWPTHPLPITASQQPVMHAGWFNSHSRCNAEVKADANVIREDVPGLSGFFFNLNPQRLTHQFTHIQFIFRSLIINKSQLSVLGGSRSRTNSLPPPDKQQEVMRWGGRGQFPVSCENSSSFSIKAEWTQ